MAEVPTQEEFDALAAIVAKNSSDIKVLQAGGVDPPVPPVPTPGDYITKDGQYEVPVKLQASDGRKLDFAADGTFSVDGVKAVYGKDVKQGGLKDGVPYQFASESWGSAWFDIPPLQTPGNIVKDPFAPPPIPPDPNDLPDVITGIVLPAGFRDFTGMTMVPGEFDNDLNPSQWQSGDTIIPYLPNLPFIKSGVLGMRCTALSDPTPGCSEVQWNESYKWPNGEFWTVALVDFHTYFNNAQCWTYAADPNVVPGARASEVDNESSPLFGDAQGIHEIDQTKVPPPMGPYYSWFMRGNYGVDWSKPIVTGIKWNLDGGWIEFYLYNLGSSPVMTNRVTKDMVPVGFISEPMKPWISFRPTGWYDDQHNLRDGWTGLWDKSAGMMQVFGWKANPI